MKYLLLVVPIISCNAVVGQTKADYENTIRKIGKFYNKKMVDSLTNLYSPGAKISDITVWAGKDIDELKISNGRMLFYEYIGVYDGLTLFKTEFSRSARIAGIALDKDCKILRFSFKVSSAYTDSLLHIK